MLRDFTKDAFDVIIQAGQSNAEGYGVGPVEEPYRPTDRVWYMNPDRTITHALELVAGNEIQSNFALPFARAYIRGGRLAEGRRLLILRTAVGGTGFLDGRWGVEDCLYLRMLDMIRLALSLNPENRLVALLWHQGESDAEHGASFEVHYHHLMTLVKGVRDGFGVPDLPFVAGDFVYHWKNDNMGKCLPVVKAMRAVCADCGHGRFVETDGLRSNWQELGRDTLGWWDCVHFSRASLYELGERYYAAYDDILTE